MKNSHIYTILAAIYLSPHMTPAVGIGCGVYLAACSLYAIWREA